MALPGWYSLSSVVEIHAALEAVAVIFFVLLVVFEVWAHLDKKREHLLESISLICFAIAILGEVCAYPYSRRIDTLSKEASLATEGKIAALNKEAGAARKEAGESTERAGKALERASKADEQSERLRRENLLTKLAILKLEQKQVSRSLNGPQGAELSERLKLLGEQYADMFVHGGEDDTLALASQLHSILVNGAGWHVRTFDIPSEFLRGIWVDNLANNTPSTERIVIALVDSLNFVKLGAQRWPAIMGQDWPRVVAAVRTPVGWTLERAPIRIQIGAKLGFQTSEGKRH